MLLLCYVGHARISRQHSAAPQWGARPGTPCSIHAASRSVECRREPVINQAQMVIRRLDRQREKRAVAGRDRHADQRQMLAYTPRPTVRPLSRPAHTHTHLPTAASSLTTRRPTTQYQQQQQQRHSLGTSLPGSHRYLDEMQVSTWPGPAYTTSRTR